MEKQIKKREERQGKEEHIENAKMVKNFLCMSLGKKK